MQHIETKFLRLEKPVALGSYIEGWRVTWLGGWTRGHLSFLVMVARRSLEQVLQEPRRNSR